jgi:nucleotide-binding universal stress UspA family protein
MARKSPFSKVLFLVETSSGALEAARYTLALVKAADARLVAVAVVDTDTLKHLLSTHILAETEMRELQAELEESCRRQLAYVTDLAKKEGVKVEAALLKGSCHREVMRAQREHAADLVVLAPFRASMATRDLMANEKQLIADEAECPVLILR